MPFESVYPFTTDQVGQGLAGPGERRGYSHTLSAHTAASIAFGTSTTRFQHTPYFFNQLNPLFYGPTPELRPNVPNALMEQQTFVQQVFGYRTPYWQGIAGLHPGNYGYGTSIIRGLTDFGSGFDREKALSRSAAIFTNPLVTGLATTALLGVPSFHDPVRVGFLSAQAAALGWARGGPIGAAIGLGAFYGLDKAGQAINKAANQGTYQQPTDWDVMRHFMLYGLVEGGLAAGTSAAFLQGSPVRSFAHEVAGIVGGVKSLITGKSFDPDTPVAGLAPEFQEIASPFRRWYQSSIVHSAGLFNRKMGMSEDFAMKFSEAFHGESAYVMRAAQRYGGNLRDISHLDFYKALGKDIGIGAAGGLFENIFVGGAYIALTHILNRPVRISGKDDDYNTLAGLHPGAEATLGVATIQSMTAFGSGLNVDKVLNWDKYSSKIAVENRAAIQSALAAIPSANIIGFDIETTGLQTPLEMRKGVMGRMTEFAIGTSSETLHGFTEQASESAYAKAAAANPSFASQFNLAADRYQASYGLGKTYRASDVLNEITSRIVPSKTNILTGHNIHSFDIKFLSAELAMERGHVTPDMLKSWRDNPTSEQMKIINQGWEKANAEIRNAFASKDANIMVLDTLGGYGRFPRVYPEAEGAGFAASFTRGYLPGLADFWEGKGIEKGSLHFATTKGTQLESLMRYFGVPFEGAAHDPRSDVRASLQLLQGVADSDRISALDTAIQNRRLKPLKAEFERFVTHQITEQRTALASGGMSGGAKMLAEQMVSAMPSAQYTAPAKTLEQAFTRLPVKTQLVVGGVAGVLAYSVYRMVFAPTHKERNTQINGLHPGDRGYATSTIRGMTPFGSGYNWIKGLATKFFGSEIRQPAEDLVLHINTDKINPPIWVKKHAQKMMNEPSSGYKPPPHIMNSIQNRINGIHPGDRGIATDQVRKMTDFGSGFSYLKNLFKSLIGIEEVSKPIEMTTWVHEFSSEERNALALRAGIDQKHIWKHLLESSNDGNALYRGLERRHPKQRHTAGLVNYVLHDNAIKHTSYQGKSL